MSSEPLTQRLEAYRFNLEDEFEMEEWVRPVHPLSRELREAAATMLKVAQGLENLADAIEEAGRGAA